MKFRSMFSVVLVLTIVAVGSASAQAGTGNHYLVLGDSVAFGYIDSAGYEYFNPTNFVPYADYVSSALRLIPANASCPGETSSSFLSLSAPDDGCRAFRASFPLHVGYTSTQLAFATNYLKTHRDTRLVTIQVGADDGFILENLCAQDVNPEQCIANGAPQLFATVATNMQTTLAALRATGYKGVIVIVNYYSLDYTDAGQTQLIAGLNQALSTPAAAYHAVIADAFSAFLAVASSDPLAQGRTCVAGLLNASVQNQLLCDVHPSQSGHKLIAKLVAQAYQAVRN